MSKIMEMTEEEFELFQLDDDWQTEISWEEFEEEPDPHVYIMALDPGGTTGVAMLRIDTRDDKINPELIYLHQITDGRYGFKEWFYGSTVQPNVVIVSEKWRERHIKGADREPIYIEGSMHMLWGDENIEYQYPDVKELIPDQWLKDNNLWTEGKRHQMDALKHAFAYLRNEEHSATVESLSGEGDGEPMAQPGQAENAQLDPSQGSAGSSAEAMAEAMEQLGEAAEGTGQAVAQLLEELKPYEETYNENHVYQQTTEEAPDIDFSSLIKDHKGTKRTRNGAFSGFNPEDAGEGRTLFDD